MKSRNKGITLIGLVITIVIMLILTGITINLLFGDNGLITKTKLAKKAFLGEDAKQVVEDRVNSYIAEKGPNGELDLYDFWYMYNSEYLLDEEGESTGVKNPSYDPNFVIYLFEEDGAVNFPSIQVYTKGTRYTSAVVIYKGYQMTVNNNFTVAKEVKVIADLTEEDKNGLVNEKINNNKINARISAWNHSLAIDNNGDVWAWGENKSGKLGLGDSTAATNIPNKINVAGFQNIIQVSAMYDNSLALDEDGNVWSWGSNTYGQLGLGDSTAATNIPNKINVKDFQNIVQICAGKNFSLALDSSGNVWSWGANAVGQLGRNDATLGNTPTKIVQEGFSNIKQISVGETYSLALDSSGNVWSWGSNVYGQLGLRDNGQRNSPIKIPNIQNIVQVEVGEISSMALDKDGKIYLWGAASAYGGCLGLGASNKNVPTLKDSSNIGVDNKIIKIGKGCGHNLVIDNLGKVWGFGYNANGELGTGYSSGVTAIQNPTSMALDATTQIVQVAGGRNHTLMVDSEGSIWACGYNLYGQIGNGRTGNILKPIKVLDANSGPVYPIK